MRVLFLTKKDQKKAIAYLVGLTRVIQRNNVQLFQEDMESYTFCLEALCELSYIIGDIPGINEVRHHGIEEGNCDYKTKQLMYLCDQQACKNCSYPDCKHTTDISHAKNFVVSDNGCYWEVDDV